MKKALLIIICIILALALCACGSKTDPAQQSGESAPNGEAADLEGFEKIDQEQPFGQYRSVEELLKILSGEAEDESAETPYFEGGAPEFTEDEKSTPADYAGGGSVTVFSDDPWEQPGVEFTEFEGMEGAEEGASGQAGDTAGEPGGWGAYSEYTSGLAAPAGIAPQQISTEGGAFMAMFTLSGESQYSDYVAVVKSAGFTKGADEQDMSDYGMDVMIYSASHADGRMITLTFSGGTLSVAIEK